MLHATLYQGRLRITADAWGGFVLDVAAGTPATWALDACTRPELHTAIGLRRGRGHGMPEILASRLWRAMPYGISTADANGSRLLFHRGYRPIAKIFAGGRSEPIWDAPVGVAPEFYLWQDGGLDRHRTRRIIAALAVATGADVVAEHHAQYDHGLMHGSKLAETRDWFQRRVPRWAGDIGRDLF